MKRITLVIISLSLYFSFRSNAQFAGPNILNELSGNSVITSFAEDFDQDGDEDILGIGIPDFDFTITNILWYANEGNGNFSSAISIDQVTGFISEFFFEDLDKDGILDLILVIEEEEEMTISWYKSDGQGSFEQNTLVSLDPQRVPDIDLLDVNEDGHLDIVNAELSFPSEIYYYRNDGQQNFATKQTLINLDNFIFGNLELADLNNDNRIDIISRTRSSEKTSIGYFQNLGQGNFAAGIELDIDLPATTRIRGGLLFEDMDGDTDSDMVYSSGLFFDGKFSYSIFWVENLGALNFAAPQLLLEDVRFYQDELRIFDIDQDQDMDIFSSSMEEDNVIRWLENDGDGNFTRKDILIDGYAGYSGSGDLLMGDFTQNGANDLVLSLYDVLLLPNDGQESFDSFEFIEGVVYLGDPLILDYNQDGLNDYLQHLSTFSPGGSIDLYTNIGSVQFKLDRQLLETDGILFSQIVTKINDDDFPDLVAYEYPSDQIVIYWGDAEGNFSEKNILTTTDLPDILSPFVISDWNKDGDMDIIVVASKTALQLFSNDGQGNFSVQELIQLPASSNGVFQLEIGDLNQDERADIALIHYDTSFINQASVYLQEENGVLSQVRPQIPNNDNFEPNLVRLADMNQDEQLDLVMAWSEGFRSAGIIYWYPELNAAPTEVLSHTAPIADLQILDYNADQKMDLVLLANAPFEDFMDLYLYNNNGNGYNSIPLDSTPIFEINRLSLADLDGDLDQDIILTQNTLNFENSSIAAWYENLSGLPQINGLVFWDENRNGELDEDESMLTGTKTQLMPTARYSFSDDQGQFQYFVESGNYQLSLEDLAECLELTTPAQYDITVDASALDVFKFGLNSSADEFHLSPYIRTASTRCGFTIPVWINLENDGCSPQDGQLKLVLDPRTSLQTTNLAISQQIGDTLVWDFPNIFPTDVKQIKLLVEMPGVEFFGDTVRLTAIGVNQNGTTSSIYAFQSEIRCAYDPNDKLVFPNRGNGKNYTLFEEDLEYTIRFQNTGNDTAFTVVIRDTLDQNLDLESFQPLNASHSFSTLLDENTRVVTFTFENILLPDSTTNEPLSHGYVSFSISPNEGLSENTIIENSAGIFFDFNPPIITNTTVNTMVSTLPVSVNTNQVKKIADLEIEAFPNPFTDQIQFELSAQKARTISLRLTDISGRLLIENNYDLTPGNNNIRINTDRMWPSGTYFYTIKNKEGTISGKLIKMDRK